MGLETGSFVADFVPANPVAGDGAGQGDDHLRLIKDCVQRTFPNFGNVFHKVQLRSTGLAIPATDNTSRFVIDNSATTTVTLSLPAAASITAGFMLLVTPLTGATALVDPDGAGTINGSTQLVVGDRNTAFLYYTGTSWLADILPNGQGAGSVFHNGLTVSGGTELVGALTVKGDASFSATVVVGSSLRALAAFYTAGTATLSGTVAVQNLMDLQSGQVKFPATQNASANANTLDDYEEGSWTPLLSFDTPGDLNVVYSFNTGTYTKIGNVVHAFASIATTTFTHTTASGRFRVNGLPFAISGTQDFPAVFSRADGIVWTATTEQVSAHVLPASSTAIGFYEMLASGSGQTEITASQLSSGVNKQIRISITYHV